MSGKGAYPHATPTFAVYEEDNVYRYYRPGSTQPLRDFEREREVIAAARTHARAIGAAQTRVVFLVPTDPQ